MTGEAPPGGANARTAHLRTRPLTLALPKGRLLDEALPLLGRAGFPLPPLNGSDRRLLVEEGGWRYLLVRPSDVPTYVEYGAADVGLVGKDVLLEQEPSVAELADLGFGACRLVVAVPGSSAIQEVDELDFHSRVATKYPRVAERFFQEQGLSIELVTLKGSIELAPAMGLAEAILDLTQTGRTLEENRLRVIAEVARSSARLIANPVRLRLREEALAPWLDRLLAAANEGGGTP
ncbi:ATP phosphoribosyltransferase [Limnochorda pilosa]|uniref:ATP phosphoribosyltransferase n=1 Tax=Limnochorda pilosa TaxID=1555112 RepID=A0A0K2SNG0_LIMPI|nr:ATP phosphoribosyltransferase [Limnochorda pilosa]BAS28653.1 ATP phosphoribosyltransferase [Limnochorda pilosa]